MTTPTQADRGEINRALIGLLLALSLASLDGNIVGPALPRIVSDLGGLAHISWVVTAFAVAATATTPLYGRLSDQFGRKPAFFVSIGIFVLGSMLCGLAQSMAQLIAFRTVQGLGAGGLLTLTQTALADIVPPAERGYYQGFVTAVFAVCSVAGPLVGGVITDALSWPWIFYINLPVGLVSLVMISASLRPQAARVARRIDFAGFGLLISATCTGMLALSWGGVVYPWGSGVILALLAATLALLAGLVVVERSVRSPALPPRLFVTPVFTRGAACMFLSLAALACATVFIPLYLQLVVGVSATAAGLRMAPIMGGIIVTSIAGGRFVARTGRYRRLPVIGLSVAAVSYGLLAAAVARGIGTAGFEGLLVLLGLGSGLVMPNITTAVQNGVRPRDLGVATATLAFFRSLGAAFGVALAGMLLAASLQSRLPPDLAGGPGRAGGDAVLEHGLGALRALSPGARAAISGAYGHALSSIFLTCCLIATLAAGIAVFLPELPLRGRAEGKAPG